MKLNPKVETALWMIGGGAVGGVVQYVQGHLQGISVNWGGMESAAVFGGLTAFETHRWPFFQQRELRMPALEIFT